MHNFEDMPMPSFCDSPESVERFAAREPDARLKDLLRAYADPAAIRAGFRLCGRPQYWSVVSLP